MGEVIQGKWDKKSKSQPPKSVKSIMENAYLHLDVARKHQLKCENQLTRVQSEINAIKFRDRHIERSLRRLVIFVLITYPILLLIIALKW